MAMYFMSGKTFLETYIEEDPKKVLSTQFVIVSSSIRKKGKYKKQILNANNNFLVPQDLLVDYSDYKHDQNYKDAYFEICNESKALLATLIKYTLEENMTIVFLCGQREKKYRALNMLQEYMEMKFGFHMYDYKKYKNGKEKPRVIDESYVLKKCNKIISKAEKDAKTKQLKTKEGRSKMSKKDLKKELKKRGLYLKDMSKSEMLDMLDAFL